MAKSNETLSLAKSVIVHGIEIKKMPCGRYFEAFQTLKELPENFMKELSNNEEDFKISEMFSLKNIGIVITRLLIILPDFSFNFISKLLDVEVEKLKNELTPKEVLDVLQEFYKINDLESFFDQTKSIANKVMTLIGFKK